MGTYTEHWKEHKRKGVRGVIYTLLWLIVGLPVTALISLGVERLTGSYPGYLHFGLLLVWLVVFTNMVLRFSRVICPRCGTRYSQGKWVYGCPKCSLRIHQDEP
jgi:hypothetical protein